jgi:hypothetical protein
VPEQGLPIWPYTWSVRVHVAALLAFFILTIACADPLCCSDGCEKGGMAATHSSQTGADCPSCLAAVVAHHTPIIRAEIATQLGEVATFTAISAFRTDVDHPPRLA